MRPPLARTALAPAQTRFPPRPHRLARRRRPRCRRRRRRQSAAGWPTGPGRPVAGWTGEDAAWQQRQRWLPLRVTPAPGGSHTRRGGCKGKSCRSSAPASVATARRASGSADSSAGSDRGWHRAPGERINGEGLWRQKGKMGDRGTAKGRECPHGRRAARPGWGGKGCAQSQARGSRRGAKTGSSWASTAKCRRGRGGVRARARPKPEGGARVQLDPHPRVPSRARTQAPETQENRPLAATRVWPDGLGWRGCFVVWAGTLPVRHRTGGEMRARERRRNGPTYTGPNLMPNGVGDLDRCG